MRDGNRVQDSCNRLNWGARDAWSSYNYHMYMTCHNNNILFTLGVYSGMCMDIYNKML